MSEGEFQKRLKLWHENPSAWHPYEVDRWIWEAMKDFPRQDTKAFNDMQNRNATDEEFMRHWEKLAWERMKWYIKWFGDSES